MTLHYMTGPPPVRYLCRYQNITPHPNREHSSSKNSNSRHDADVSRNLFWCENFFPYEAREGRLVGVMDGAPGRGSKQAWNWILWGRSACHVDD